MIGPVIGGIPLTTKPLLRFIDGDDIDYLMFFQHIVRGDLRLWFLFKLKRSGMLEKLNMLR